MKSMLSLWGCYWNCEPGKGDLSIYISRKVVDFGVARVKAQTGVMTEEMGTY